MNAEFSADVVSSQPVAVGQSGGAYPGYFDLEVTAEALPVVVSEPTSIGLLVEIGDAVDPVDPFVNLTVVAYEYDGRSYEVGVDNTFWFSRLNPDDPSFCRSFSDASEMTVGSG